MLATHERLMAEERLMAKRLMPLKVLQPDGSETGYLGVTYEYALANTIATGNLSDLVYHNQSIGPTIIYIYILMI